MHENLEITFRPFIFTQPLRPSNTSRVQNFKYQSPGCVGSNFIVVQLEWKRTRTAYDQLDHWRFNVVVVVRVIGFGDSATQWSVLISTSVCWSLQRIYLERIKMLFWLWLVDQVCSTMWNPSTVLKDLSKAAKTQTDSSTRPTTRRVWKLEWPFNFLGTLRTRYVCSIVRTQNFGCI